MRWFDDLRLKEGFSTYMGGRVQAELLGMLLDHLPGETDEQISRTILSRGAAALEVYLPVDASAPPRLSFAGEQRLDRSSEAAKDAFDPHAATPDRSVKASYFSRYFDDRALNEAWASESLDAFNTIEGGGAHPALPPPCARPAGVDSSEQDLLPARLDRRVHWRPARSGALQVVDQFLDTHPALPIDVRRKTLTAHDELTLTVRIKAATFEESAHSIK